MQYFPSPISFHLADLIPFPEDWFPFTTKFATTLFFAINKSIIHAFKEQENTSKGDKFQRIFIISFSGNMCLREYSHEINIYHHIDQKMVADFSWDFALMPFEKNEFTSSCAISLLNIVIKISIHSYDSWER